MDTATYLPLDKDIPQPPHCLPYILFLHIGVIEHQDMLIGFLDLCTELRQAGDIDLLLSGGPFDLCIGQGGIHLDQDMGPALSACYVDDREEGGLL